jgi:hypothetical protein
VLGGLQLSGDGLRDQLNTKAGSRRRCPDTQAVLNTVDGAGRDVMRKVASADRRVDVTCRGVRQRRVQVEDCRDADRRMAHVPDVGGDASGLGDRVELEGLQDAAGLH